MEQRKLGKQGPEISAIGFGTWAMGGGVWGGSWGPQDDRESIEAIHVALDSGVTWFDTAAVYGLGHSEEVLGHALGARRKDVIVATKFGTIWDEQGKTTRTAPYESVLREAEASLKRLNTDYIDLYQQHWPDVHPDNLEGTLRALDELVASGKVRYVGVSNYDVPLLEKCLAVRHIDSLQPPYNMLTRRVEAEILPYCREHGIGVVAYSPLASGLLGGHYTTSTTFDPGDWRSRDARFSGEGLRKNLAIVERLRAIAGRYNCTVAQLAVAWVLANPAVTSAIVGVRRKDHIVDALPAASLHLDAATLTEIDEALKV